MVDVSCILLSAEERLRISPSHAIVVQLGPLATVIRVKDENQAIAIANNHRYGLAASIWTTDREHAYHLSRKIEAGSVFVNSLVRSDSRVPFGGIKKLGYGRELGAIGIKEFMNAKSLIIE